MKVAIHLSFMEAVRRLQAIERRQVYGSIRRLSEAGPTPGMRPHRLSDPCSRILSLSVNMDLRILALMQDGNYVLVHVDHHDAAYEWAEKNSVGLACAEAIGVTHQVTHRVPGSAGAAGAAFETFGANTRKALETMGCPAALVDLLAQANDERELLERLELLAPEWQELILDAISGAKLQPPTGAPSNIWVVPSDAALRAAMGLPGASWRIFLHPNQHEIVEAGIDRDLVVAGGPGTGKTVALVHRACRLADQLTDPSQECVALVGHSPTATDLMISMVRSLRGAVPNSLHITDMVAVGRRGRPRASDILEPRTRNRPWHLGKQVSALVIDEAQDLHRTTKSYILGRRPSITTHLTIAVDPNQNIFADNTADGALLSTLRRADIRHLRYSYRIPREAGMVALNLLDRVQDSDESAIVDEIRKECRNMSFGFSSHFVRLESYDNLSDGVSRAASDFERLREAGYQDIAIVFCGTRRDRVQHAEVLKALGYDPETDRGLITPRQVKGKEYDYCLVLGPELLIDSDHGRPDFAYHAIYVALSRCRRGVVLFGHREFLSKLRVAGTDPR